MCEFNVYLDGEKIMTEVIYAKVEGDNVLISDIIGEDKIIENATIIEVDVPSTSLILAKK